MLILLVPSLCLLGWFAWDLLRRGRWRHRAGRVDAVRNSGMGVLGMLMAWGALTLFPGSSWLLAFGVILLVAWACWRAYGQRHA